MKILTDACFWIALFDDRDQFHSNAIALYDYVSIAEVYFPWPIMYEIFSTRFVRKKHSLTKFKIEINKIRKFFICDNVYRESVLESIVDKRSFSRNLSLVDLVIRSILDDRSFHFDAFITFNVNDFFDVCSSRRVEILAEV